MSPSPVVAAMDATEKGQLAYHIGTAAGLQLALANLAPGAGATYFPFHLSRAQAGGATFVFANAQRPDLVIYSIIVPPPAVPPTPPVLSHMVVWECKGHAVNVGQAPLGPALFQSVALTTLTALPGAAPLAAPLVPAAYVASQVDTVFGDYRIQLTDPESEPEGNIEIGRDEMGKFLRFYYEPFMEFLNSRDARSERRYEGRRFETLEILPGIRFGMDAEIYEELSDRGADMVAVSGRVLTDGYENGEPERVWVDSTGLSMEVY